MKHRFDNRWDTVVVVAIALAVISGMLLSPLRIDFMVDFRAFYCAGSVLVHDANPYLQQPLQQCEDAVRAPWEGAMPGNIALPAPLPPYILAAYGLFSVIPFSTAWMVYLLFLVVAFFATMQLLQKITNLPVLAVGAAITPIAWGDAILRGQPLTLVLLALAGAALFARRREWWKASLAIFCVAAQPQAALPAVVALFWLAPKARLPIVTVATMILLVSVAIIPHDAVTSYVTGVLPAHALANAEEWQLSLTSILTSMGYPDNVAVRWGELSYFFLASAGIVAGVLLSRRFRDPAFAVFVPPAFAVFLGVHVHYQQLALAFPAFLLLARYEPRLRTLTAVALVLAVVQPLDTATIPLLSVTWILIAVSLGLTLAPVKRSMYIAILPCIVLGIAAIAAAFGPHQPPKAALIVHAFRSTALAEESWGDFVRQVLVGTTLAMQWLRGVTLCGVALGLAMLTATAFRTAARGSESALPLASVAAAET